MEEVGGSNPPAGTMLLNITGSILDSDSRRVGSNPAGATRMGLCQSVVIGAAPQAVL